MKQPLQKLPLPLFFPVYSAWNWLSKEVPSSHVRRRLAIPSAAEVDLFTHKSSDTVFILGSGPSINEINPERWSGIRAHDTIALNNWLVHPFVPKFYCFDSASQAPGYEVAYNFLLNNLIRRADDYRDTIKFISNFKPASVGQIGVDLPARCRHNLYHLATPPVVARTQQEFRSMVRYYKARGLFKPARRIGSVFKYNSILTTCLSLAIRLGYKNVVLCGVDLGTFQYFYHEARYFPETASVSVRPREERHDTMVAKPWLIPMDESLMILREEVLQPAGIELFVENRRSLLYPRVPAAPDSLFRPRSMHTSPERENRVALRS